VHVTLKRLLNYNLEFSLIIKAKALHQVLRHLNLLRREFRKYTQLPKDYKPEFLEVQAKIEIDTLVNELQECVICCDQERILENIQAKFAGCSSSVRIITAAKLDRFCALLYQKFYNKNAASEAKSFPDANALMEALATLQLLPTDSTQKYQFLRSLQNYVTIDLLDNKPFAQSSYSLAFNPTEANCPEVKPTELETKYEL